MKIICDVYTMRNAIHLHAEHRRSVNYALQVAEKAYREPSRICLPDW